jgi:hypothetical protein
MFDHFCFDHANALAVRADIDVGRTAAGIKALDDLVALAAGTYDAGHF